MIGRADPRFRWSSKDFSTVPVRERLSVAVQDVCNNYDVDGIELDFLKGPVHFPETFSPAPTRVSEANVAIMTSLVGEIRSKTKAIATRRGRPILVACHVPEHVEQALFVGLDVETWLSIRFFDILIVGRGSAVRNMMGPLQDMVALGKKYGVPVYAANATEANIQYADSSGNNTEEVPAVSPETWCAYGKSVHHAGAGVYLFNFYLEGASAPYPTTPQPNR